MDSFGSEDDETRQGSSRRAAAAAITLQHPVVVTPAGVSSPQGSGRWGGWAASRLVRCPCLLRPHQPWIRPIAYRLPIGVISR